MSKNKNWQKWIMWGLPIYFLALAGKELYLCNVIAESLDLGLNDILQYWFSDQKETYSLLHVKALLRMQAAFYGIVISIVFLGWAFSDSHFRTKAKSE